MGVSRASDSESARDNHSFIARQSNRRTRRSTAGMLCFGASSDSAICIRQDRIVRQAKVVVSGDARNFQESRDKPE